MGTYGLSGTDLWYTSKPRVTVTVWRDWQSLCGNVFGSGGVKGWQQYLLVALTSCGFYLMVWVAGFLMVAGILGLGFLLAVVVQ